MNLLHFKELDSTQDFAIRLITNNNIYNPIFIIADKQTKGRGRNRNTVWVSQDGNLHGSLCLNIEELGISFNNVQELNTLVMTGIFNMLKKSLYNTQLRLKLPNDIYINNKKLAGVLIEVFYPIAIIGIGINLISSPISTSLSILEATGTQIKADDDFINLLYNSIKLSILNKSLII